MTPRLLLGLLTVSSAPAVLTQDSSGPTYPLLFDNDEYLAPIGRSVERQAGRRPPHPV